MPTSSLINNKSCPTYRGALQTPTALCLRLLSHFLRKRRVACLCAVSLFVVTGCDRGPQMAKGNPNAVPKPSESDADLVMKQDGPTQGMTRPAGFQDIAVESAGVQILLDGTTGVMPLIVFPETASEQERFAVEELRKHLTAIVGAEIQTASETEVPLDQKAPVLFVGQSKSARFTPSIPMEKSAPDGTSLVAPTATGVSIHGTGSHGTIYAVYDFLERLGVRWFTSDVAKTPKRETISAREVSGLHTPKTRIRYFAWNFPSTAEWRSRMRLNGMSASLPDQMGGYFKEASGGDCHYLRQLVPTSLFKEHPKWFAMKQDGKRVPGSESHGGEYCTANPDFRAFVVKQVTEKLLETGAKEIWIGQSDAQKTGCYCPLCVAERNKYSGEGNQESYKKAGKSDSPLDFESEDPLANRGGDIPWSVNNIALANYVSEQIRTRFPDVSLLTLAYSFTMEAPPGGLRANDNVVVYIAGPAGDGITGWFKGYEPGEFTVLNEWIKTGSRLRMYTYGASNFGFFWPFPNILAHAKDIDSLYVDGVREFFDQGALGGTGSGLVELRAYLSARMIWDPESDPRDVINEFCEGVYGAGGKFISQYISDYHDYVSARGINEGHNWGNLEGWRKWVNEETVAMGEKALANALAAVKGNRELEERIERAMLEVYWARHALSLDKQGRVEDGALRFFRPEAEEKGRTAAGNFVRVMQKAGFDRLNELTPWSEEKSPQSFLSRDVKVYELKDQANRVFIAPSLGARLVRWDHPAYEGNLLKTPSGLDPLKGGYQEFSGFSKESPGGRNEYTVESMDGNRSLTLTAELDNGLTATRVFSLAGGVLSVTSSYFNRSEKPVELRFRTHPELLFEKFAFITFVSPSTEGLTRHRMAGKTLKEHAIPVARNAQSGWALLGNERGGAGLLTRFEPSQIDQVYAFQDGPDGYNTVTLELFGKSKVLAPHETWTIRHSYQVLDDANKWIEANTP